MSVRYDVDGPIVVITLDRPEVANAIDRPTAEELAAAFRRFEADEALAVAVLTGANGKFSITDVPPGNYTLVIESPGFRSVKREGIALSGQPFEQNATLQVGSLTETITVADDGIQLNACVESPVGGNIRPPTKTRDVRPIYPTGVKPAQVVLDARIGPDGFVTRVETVGDVDAALANAAINAVSGWEFTPTYLDCQPIEVQMKVSVNFVAAK